MWTKLNSNQDIDLIAEGNIIVKYPIDGEPQQEIDLSSEEMFMLYEVCQVTGAEVLLQVPVEDQRPDTSVAFVSADGLQSVCLSKRDIMQQRVWWIKQGN